MTAKTSRLLGIRAISAYATLFTLFIIGFALYAQIYQGVKPCPLCILQRLVFILLALFFIGGLLYVPQKFARRIYYSFGLILALVGLAIASRHIYLQHLPAGLAPSCGPGFNFILQNFPVGDALRMILTGSGECALVDWTLWGLSMPEWSFLCFGLLALVNILQILRKDFTRI